VVVEPPEITVILALAQEQVVIELLLGLLLAVHLL
jgi:hypothetical protein